MNATTGDEGSTVRLTPPFPVPELLRVIDSELADTIEDRSLARRLLEDGLPPLVSPRVLSLVLGISHKLLYAMAIVPDKYYRRFELQKKTGGVRHIATPRVFLKVVQRWILTNILYRKALPTYVAGFVPGRGLMANARPHVGRAYLAKVDIEEFFPSVGRNQVGNVFQGFGFPAEVSDLLTRLTILDGILPQGAPTSPYLANLVFLPCDLQIEKLADSSDIQYSRYADDMTFSSDRRINGSLIAHVGRVIAAHSFRINRKKTRLLGPGQRLMTTGMVISSRVHPPRFLRRQLRARFHQAWLNPASFADQANQLLGWAAYVNMYDPDLGAKYLGIARQVLTKPR